MEPTIFRQACGTKMGLLLHQDLNEQPCGTCQQRERARLVAAEQTRPVETVDASMLRDSPTEIARRVALLNSSAYMEHPPRLRVVS